MSLINVYHEIQNCKMVMDYVGPVTNHMYVCNNEHI